MNAPVRTIQIQKEAAKNLLRSLFDDSDPADMDLVRDTVEGQTDLFEAFDRAIARVNTLQDLEKAIAERVDILRKRLDRFKNQRETIRAAMLQAMAEIGVQKVERPTATLSMTKGRASAAIVSEAELPSKFVREEIKIKPDTKAILEALLAGEKVPGAELSNGAPSLAIRGA